jgi:hypothetical protein
MPRGMMGKARHKWASPLTTDVDYSDDELELIKAVDRWRRDHPGRFPTCCDVLQIAKALGYAKHPGGGSRSESR